MALRHVNKAFYRSASSWLFQHIDARCSSSGTIPSLERLMKLSNSLYSEDVRQIDFGFRDTSSYSLSNAVNALYIEDLFGCLSSCLIKFSNLTALEFHEPPSGLSQDQRRSYIEAVVSTLRYVPLSNLRELEVKFPITYDFGRFFPNQISSVQIPIEDIIRSLRHLGVSVREYTNQQDQRYWRRPVLPEYAALPNNTYASRLFRLIEIAPNLRSLAVHSMDILNMDFLAFPPSLCLRNLCLLGVSVSCNCLLSLINQSSETMSYVNFSLIKLNSGTWRQVLLRMCHLPRLLDINIDHSGYSLTGSSSDLALRLLPAPDSPLNIETMYSFDEDALGNLQRQVNSNRIAFGLRPFPETDYRHIKSAAIDFVSDELHV
jgi:hypothetical protein